MSNILLDAAFANALPAAARHRYISGAAKTFLLRRVIEQRPEITAAELAEKTNLPLATVYWHLQRIKSKRPRKPQPIDPLSLPIDEFLALQDDKLTLLGVQFT